MGDRNERQDIDGEERSGDEHQSVVGAIDALTEEVVKLVAGLTAWKDTARQYGQNADYWRTRAERAEEDADRLAEALRLYADHSGLGNECPTCVVLDLHDKEAEAR